MGSKRDKHRYIKVTYDGSSFVDTPANAAAFLDDLSPEERTDYTTTEVWKTKAEIEAMPEFTGF